MPTIIPASLPKQATVRREGSRVLLFAGDQLVLELPWQAADELARAISGKSRRAEEHAKAEAIARDQAILMRAGARVGLSSDPKIQDEAGKLAAWDSDLRRYMPGGVRTQEVLGEPAVITHPAPRRTP